MKFFSLLKNEEIHLEGDKRVVAGHEMATLLEAQGIVDKAKNEATLFIEETKKECENLRDEAKKNGLKRDKKSGQSSFIFSR